MKEKLTKRTMIIGGLILALLISGTAFALVRTKDPASDPTGTTALANEGINYNQPTEAEQQAGDLRKDQIVEESSKPTPTPMPTGTKKDVTPIIVNAFYNAEKSQATVSGFVTGILEDGGTCTVILTYSGAATVTRTTESAANVSRTECAPITVPRSDFAVAGEWVVTLRYASASAGGTSETKTMNIP